MTTRRSPPYSFPQQREIIENYLGKGEPIKEDFLIVEPPLEAHPRMPYNSRIKIIPLDQDKTGR